MLTHTDGGGNATTVLYNARNLPVARVEPGGISGSAIDAAKAMSYTYYADGSVETETDQNGVTASYAYDIHGRLLSKSAGGKSVSFTYDNNGNVLTQTDQSGTTTRAYDSLNRTISKNVPGIGLTTYLYDVTAGMPAGCLGQTTTDPKGNATTKIYDQMGRLSQVKSGSDTTTYTYYANGNRQSMAYPNGVTAQYAYYADNRLHTLANMINSTYLSTFNYAYDGAGNMLTKLELKGTTEYSYDTLGRVSSVTEPDGRVTEYEFDAAGNRLTETVTVNNSVTITSYAYNEQNRLLSSTETSDGAEKTVEFHYDNNGSQISKLISEIAAPDGSPSYALSSPGYGSGDEITYELSGYDTFGQLISVRNDLCIAEYEYNADGLRISKSVTKEGATTTTKFLYESGNITLELDGAGAQAAHNVYGGDGVISRKTAQGARYYLYNGRGDVVQLTNVNGNVMETYDYDAFGNLLSGYLSDTNPFRYCGEYWDDETRNYYLRARYYNPATGRFTQRDGYLGNRSDPLSLNRYTYCKNNPIRYCDPTGHASMLNMLSGLVASLVVGIAAGYAVSSSQNNNANENSSLAASIAAGASAGAIIGGPLGATFGAAGGLAGSVLEVISEEQTDFPAQGTPIRSYYEEQGKTVTYVPGNDNNSSSIVVSGRYTDLFLYEGVDYYFKSSSAVMGTASIEEVITGEKADGVKLPWSVGGSSSSGESSKSKSKLDVDLENDVSLRAKVEADVNSLKTRKDREMGAAMVVQIRVPVWRIDQSGNKYESAQWLWVHKDLASQVIDIFQEIFDDPSQFPIFGAGGYVEERWDRNTDFESDGLTIKHPNHLSGTAIDINDSANPMCDINGNNLTQGKYEPGINPYSIPADGIVVKTFNDYGWSWGGDFNSTKDWMHFSYLGK